MIVIAAQYMILIMTFIAVSIPVPTIDDLEVSLSQAAASVSAGADLVEWRVDDWPLEASPDAALARLVSESPVPCIVTVRSVAEGGAFEGTPEELADFFHLMQEADVQPRYIDVEHAMWEASDVLRSACGAFDDVGLILSMHDLLGRPDDLLRRAVAMQEVESASVVKLVWRARSARDNIEAFELLRARCKPMIALCMGELGIASRVLGGCAGAFLTFASGPAGVTAEGQCDVGTLVDRYRFRALTNDTCVMAIMGWPLDHSLSPSVHNAGFASTGFDGVLLPMPVLKGWESFKATMSTILDDPACKLRGVCVTLPHKEHALRFVREAGGMITDIADRAGAANTIIIGDDGSLRADNTDAPAVVETLGIEPTGSRVAVLGAGGAARAVVAGLTEAGARVDVFNRSVERAASLVEAMSSPMCTLGDLDELTGYDVIINTTSVGMLDGPDPEGSPMECLGLPAWMLEEAAVVYDCIYAPRDTPMILAAKAVGTTVVTGEAMFLAQAQRQFVAWTGLEAPVEQWRQLID
jgi:3-dehydroquinate dehydratase/shikimate dehydrogenase